MCETRAEAVSQLNDLLGVLAELSEMQLELLARAANALLERKQLEAMVTEPIDLVEIVAMASAIRAESFASNSR